tara:strand:- start:4384 stop:4524 length:141 start_codon:yes stop_codon:yes gene_type:complete
MNKKFKPHSLITEKEIMEFQAEWNKFLHAKKNTKKLILNVKNRSLI